jgi:diacylglycerol kinase (ATP)
MREDEAGPSGNDQPQAVVPQTGRDPSAEAGSAAEPEPSDVRARSAEASPYASRSLLILNPVAGQEKPERLRRLLGGAFAVRGAAFDLVETIGVGDAERHARRAAQLGYRSVVAVGGDGTVAEVVSGLAGSDVPLAIVPRGTANQVAGNLHLPMDVERAVEVAVHGTPIPMDIGQLADGRHFALIAGAGWDAEVISIATRQMKDRWGFWAYLYAGLRRAISPSSALFRITVDEQSFEVRAATVLIANVGQIFHELLPVDLQIAPGSSVSDGLLDVCIFAPRNLPDVAAVLWKVARRRYLGDDRMLYLQAREIEIEADPPVITQVDGDPAGMTPLVARAVAGGVRVMVPAPGE